MLGHVSCVLKRSVLLSIRTLPSKPSPNESTVFIDRVESVI
jgi:hypothetical protein